MTHDSRGTMRHGERTKSTQTTRSLPARAAGAKLRLLLALISVITLLATMFVTGPFQARVADATSNAAGICAPSSGSMGGISSNENEHVDDDGVATWVGRNMWIGAPQGNNGDPAQPNYEKAYGKQDDNTENWPQRSYAVEAEGLTLVNGKLVGAMAKGEYRKVAENTEIANGQWDKWHRNGFRFGVVGFGGQVRPSKESTVLVVADNVTDNPLSLTDKNSKYVSALAFGETGRSWVGGGPYTKDNTQKYYADIKSTANDASYAVGHINKAFVKQSVYGLNGDDNQLVNWKQDGNLLQNVYYKNQDGTTERHHDFTDFQQNLERDSATLKTLYNTGDIEVFSEPSEYPEADQAKYNTANQYGYVREKYNINKREQKWGGNGSSWYEDANAEHQYKLEMTFDGTNYEKIIKFTGDGKSPTQVFHLDANQLTNGNANGISFDFENIPDNSAVVVNVMGSGPIDFHNGWRLWWNGEDISNYYVEPGADWDWDNWNQESNHWREQKREYERRNALYSKVSSSIMWNFADATYVSIRGGQVKSGQARWTAPKFTRQWNGNKYDIIVDDNQKIATRNDISVNDDPAANMIGSIMIPQGSFEDHVSTNGRVWVGQDFMMFNPEALTQYAIPEQGKEGTWNYTDYSASLVNMDQERHNFKWSASYTTQCAAIGWSKVDDRGSVIADTKWRIYSSLNQARNEKWNSNDASAYLVEVTDNGANDTNKAVGEIDVHLLAPRAAYFVREVSSADGYVVNPNIYQIDTGDSGSSLEISKVYSSATGNEIGDTSDQLLWAGTDATTVTHKAIINQKLPDVEWEKVDSETGALLGGSEWRLYKKQVENGTTTYPVIKESITDAYGTMVYLDTKTAKWPADGGVTETPKIHYKIGNRGDWTVSEMTPYGNGIYGVYVPGRGQNVKFSFFLGTVSYKASEYRPDGPADNFSSGANVQYVTVRSKNQAVEPTQPTTSLQGPEYTDLDMRQGKFKLGGLTEGEYTLQETKAPEGYWLPNEGGSQYTFKVESQNGQYTISWIASSITVNGQTIQTTQAATTATNGVTVGKISNTPTKVTWEKVDSTDKKALAGSTWTLKRGESVLAEVSDCTSGNCETGIYKDQNNAAGKFMLKRLPAGTYKLQEATAPTGYQLSETVYEFTIPQTEPDTAEVKVSANPIGNDRKLGIVKFEKVAEGTLNRLSGSEWELTFKPQGSEEDKTKWKTVPITDCTEGNPTCSADSIDRDVVPGKFQIKSLTAPYGNNNLEWGTYELRETKAPDGYNLSDRVYTFTVDKDHLESIKLYVNGQEVSGNRIGNEPGVVLPVTGAEGRHLWPAIVGALFVLAAFGCAVALRMRE